MAAALAAACLMTACSPPYRVAPRTVFFVPESPENPGGAVAPERHPRDVMITEGDLPRPYVKAGQLTVESVGLDTDISLERLRLEAARRGWDAVILVKTTKTSTGGSDNEAINYFFPPVVRHRIEGMGVILAQPTAPVAAPALVPVPDPIPTPDPVPAPKSEPAPAPAPDRVLAPDPLPVPDPVPAPAPVVDEAPPPSPVPPQPSTHAPLPPADTFLDEKK